MRKISNAAGKRFRKAMHAVSALMAVLCMAACASGIPTHDDPTRQIDGIVWQVDNATVDAAGVWDRIGATELLIQWTVVDNLAFVSGTGLPEAPRLPDWKRIASEPWAHDVILGLAGRFDETEARNSLDELGKVSERLTSIPTPLNVTGWYFPVEIDPTWKEAERLKPLLERLPRPLWVSAYDSANIGPHELADRLQAWLPNDVGVFFQDGVGVHARTPEVARQYAEILSAKLGSERVRLIVEAFRPAQKTGFRPATAEEIRRQLDAYKGFKLYLFDGPHYISDATVNSLMQPGIN